MAYLLIAALDVEKEGENFNDICSCDIWLDGILVCTSSIPAVEESHVVIELGNHTILQFDIYDCPEDGIRRDEYFLCSMEVRVDSFSTERTEQWNQKDKYKLNYATILVPEEEARMESIEERTNRIQTFLIDALSKKLFEVDEQLPESIKESNCIPEISKPPMKSIRIQEEPVTEHYGLCNGPNNMMRRTQSASTIPNRIKTAGSAAGTFGRPPMYSTGCRKTAIGLTMSNPSNQKVTEEEIAWSKWGKHRAKICDLEAKLRRKDMEVNDITNSLKRCKKENNQRIAALEKENQELIITQENLIQEQQNLRMSYEDELHVKGEEVAQQLESVNKIIEEERSQREDLKKQLVLARETIVAMGQAHERAQLDEDTERKRCVQEETVDLRRKLLQKTEEVASAYELHERRCSEFEETLRKKEEQLSILTTNIENMTKARDDASWELKKNENLLSQLKDEAYSWRILVTKMKEDNENRKEVGNIKEQSEECQRLIKLCERKDKKFEDFKISSEKELAEVRNLVVAQETKHKDAMTLMRNENARLKEDKKKLDRNLTEARQSVIVAEQRVKVRLHNIETEKLRKNRSPSIRSRSLSPIQSLKLNNNIRKRKFS